MADYARLEFECASCDFVLRFNNARYELDHEEIVTLIYPTQDGYPLIMNVKRELDNRCPHCDGALALLSAHLL